jgi:hypothetical protein
MLGDYFPNLPDSNVTLEMELNGPKSEIPGPIQPNCTDNSWLSGYTERMVQDQVNLEVTEH